MIRIGVLAARAGVSTRALRYYEEQGLLSPERTDSGQRVYPASDVDRVRLIQNLYTTGLSSRGIAVLLPLVDARQTSAEAVTMLKTERARIDRQIRDLTTARTRLDDIITITETATCASPAWADQ